MEMNAFTYAILSVIAVSLVSLVGLATLSLKVNRLKKILLYAVSFAAGALFGDVFIHLVPELIEEGSFGVATSFTILSGLIFSLVIEKFVHWRHCHVPTTESHPHPVAIMNLVGDGVHNFIDGLIIGASYLVSIPVGVATSVAVFLHEIPQEIGDFGVLLHGGFSRGRALFLNFMLALTAIVGVAIPFVLTAYAESLVSFLVPFAIGTFIYIAGSDLIPELHKETGLRNAFFQLLWFIAGIAIMSALLLIE